MIRFNSDKRKPAVTLRLLALADHLDTDTVEAMLDNFMEQLDGSTDLSMDQMLARLTRGEDPIRDLSDVALKLCTAIEWRLMNDVDREIDRGVVDVPERRWSAKLPTWLIDQWEEHARGSVNIRANLIGAALHAFLQLPDRRQGLEVCRYNHARMKAGTEHGFREAMVGLGFNMPATADEAEKAVTL